MGVPKKEGCSLVPRSQAKHAANQRDTERDEDFEVCQTVSSRLDTRKKARKEKERSRTRRFASVLLPFSVFR